MRLPKNVLTNTFRKPNVYLCESDKTKICKLETSNMQASLKFNSYSELSFEVGRTYNDNFTGETKVNPFYDKIEALRLAYLEDFGYFEIQGPELIGDGIKESKSIKTYSLEYTLSQKYLEDFYINTGEVNSQEVINAENEDSIVPIILYNETNPKLSLLNLALEKTYGWTIGHVDPQLKTLSRQFEIDRQSVYDFLMNEVCEKFNCYIVFDTINNTINVYAESPTAKFIGDGTATTFTIGSLDNTFSEVKTVSIDGYKTTKWNYNIVDGVGTLVLDDIPEEGAMIEIVGVDSTWETDVFITFDNLSQEINVNYDADSIKTVLTVTYGEDNDIRETNLGLPYLVDLSYYCTPEWLGQDLYDAWGIYQEKCNSNQGDYTENIQHMLECLNNIDFEENRLSLGYAKATVGEDTVGTYYVRGGTFPNYYYTEVSLPEEYNVNTTYYSTKTCNLEDTSKGNVAHLYEALKKYFMNVEDWKKDLDALSEEFDFMGDNAISDLSSYLASKTNKIDNSEIESRLGGFFEIMWNEVGKNPLKQMFYEPYKQIQITNLEEGWSDKDDANYGNYYTVVLLLESIEAAIAVRDDKINEYQSEYDIYQKANASISEELLMTNNFSTGQLIRLNAFLREDELHLDDIIETSQDSIDDSFKIKQDAMEAGRIELQKLCQPQLQFSMSMANIYALPEFEPIVDQFQLGNMIKVGIRPGYIKQSRLLQVDINFEDFSDFSCEFGELTSIRSQSDIHADLLKNAISAGKSVAQNASYWTKGSDQANSIDLRLQDGLLNSIEALKAADGTQSAYIDKYGIHLEAVNPNTGEVGDKRVWMVNNQIVFTDDGFKTSKSVLGEFTVDGTTYYGLLAQAVIAGYIEGSVIKGGSISIGEKDNEPVFSVDSNGNVVMNAATINGYATTGQTNHYGICNTAAPIALKVVECEDFELYAGATISVKFTYGNSVDNPKLKLPEIEPKDIYAYGEKLTADSSYNWSDNSIVSFVYDGEHWCVADSGTLYQAASLSTSVTQTAELIEAEAERALNAEAQLSAKIAINADAITSKVNRGEFGTLVEQNYDHVKIAWNKNSNYIQFEDGAMNIYTSTAHNNNTLLMKQNHQGAWYYRDGTKIGKIGTNNWQNDTSYRGLVFDLEYDASYMCWAAKDSSAASTYDVKLIYHHKSSKENQGLHLKCNTYANGNLYLTKTNRFKEWTSGGCGFDGRMTWCNNSNTTYIEIDGNNKKFEVSSSVDVDFWSNIDMHNCSILNQSDARLKTNIQDTQIDALSAINQIEMKEFDWLENGEHEDIGIIAQQLQTILPDLVHKDSTTDQLSIKTNKFIPYLIKAIQELTEYVTGGISTFSLSRKWTDTYTEDEKAAFVAAHLSNSQAGVLEELERHSILLPIEQQGEEENE